MDNMKASAQRVALTVSGKTRDETIAKARNAAFARIPIWAFFLPVTRRQQIVLGLLLRHARSDSRIQKRVRGGQVRKEMCGAGALVLSPRACSFRW